VISEVKTRSLAWFVAIPFATVLIGAFVMAENRISTSLWIQNLIFCGAGVLVCLLRNVRLRASSAERLLLLGVPAFLALTFVDAGLEHVHRWVTIGRIRLHVASLILPAFLLFFPALRIQQSKTAWVSALAIAGLLAAQPDACETSAFVAALLVSVLFQSPTSISCLVLGAMFCSLALISWTRPDPLPTIPHVEGILGLAMEVHPAVALLGLTSLATLPLPFIIIGQRGNEAGRAGALAVTAYFVLKTCTALITERFPVMLLGYGASAILGYFIALRACFLAADSLWNGSARGRA
jgi:hypothetical protein